MIKFKKRWIAFWTSVLMVFLLSFPIAVISSDYFDYTTGRLAAGQRARASTMNSIFDEISAGFDLLPDEATLNAYFAAIAALAAGSGATVSADDTTVGYLDGKLLAGAGIDFTVGDPAGDETLTILGETGTAINAGILELATNAETVAGVDTDRATTAANLTAKMAAPGAIGETTPSTIKLTNVGLKLLDTNASHVLIIKPGTDLSANHTLTVTTGDADRTITLSGNPTMGDYFDQAVKAASSPTFAEVTIGTTPVLGVGLRGLVRRPNFTYKDDDEIEISPGAYHHDGTSEQVVYWESTITFTGENDGSNADNDAFSGEVYYYLYLDDSAIITQASPLLDADCFLLVTDEPAWAPAKFGFYGTGVGTATATDRCIFAVHIISIAGDIQPFRHGGGRYTHHYVSTEALGSTNVQTAATTVTLTTLDVPSFVNTINASGTLEAKTADAVVAMDWYDVAGTDGHNLVTLERIATDQTIGFGDVVVALDEDLKFDVKSSRDGADLLVINVEGWYFPNGM